MPSTTTTTNKSDTPRPLSEVTERYRQANDTLEASLKDPRGQKYGYVYRPYTFEVLKSVRSSLKK